METLLNLLSFVDMMWMVIGFVILVLVAYVVLRIVGETYGD